MKRQAIIYSVFSVGAGGLLLYAISLCFDAWQRFGLSSTFSICALITILFALLFFFYCAITYLFMAHAVSSISAKPGGFELLIEGRSSKKSILVPALKVIRTFGEQFAQNENIPKFTLFSAGGKFWVTSVGLPLTNESTS